MVSERVILACRASEGVIISRDHYPKPARLKLPANGVLPIIIIRRIILAYSVRGEGGGGGNKQATATAESLSEITLDPGTMGAAGKLSLSYDVM